MRDLIKKILREETEIPKWFREWEKLPREGRIAGIEETFVNYQTKEKITIHQFIKSYLPELGLTLISKLNNKIIVQNDDDFNLFTFKTISDSERFIDVLTQYLMDNNNSQVRSIPTSNIFDKFKSFGFEVIECDGHNLQLLEFHECYPHKVYLHAHNYL